MSAFGRIWHLFAAENVWDNVIIIPVLFLLVLIVGFTSYRMVERPLLNLSRRYAWGHKNRNAK
jgi:peptidoglycan/LPS O-acetylase OafA/YrhL